MPRRGTLWTWTVQHFMPKAPYRSSETEATFRPFGMGYVELPGALRIETRLTENDPRSFASAPSGTRHLYARVEDAGTAVMNYAFRLADTVDKGAPA